MFKKKPQENLFCSSVNSVWSKAVWHSMLENRKKILNALSWNIGSTALCVAQDLDLVYKNEEILQ